MERKPQWHTPKSYWKTRKLAKLKKRPVNDFVDFVKRKRPWRRRDRCLQLRKRQRRRHHQCGAIIPHDELDPIARLQVQPVAHALRIVICPFIVIIAVAIYMNSLLAPSLQGPVVASRNPRFRRSGFRRFPPWTTGADRLAVLLESLQMDCDRLSDESERFLAGLCGKNCGGNAAGRHSRHLRTAQR
jgi:hypothetical protein